MVHRIENYTVYCRSFGNIVPSVKLKFLHNRFGDLSEKIAVDSTWYILPTHKNWSNLVQALRR